MTSLWNGRRTVVGCLLGILLAAGWMLAGVSEEPPVAEVAPPRAVEIHPRPGEEIALTGPIHVVFDRAMDSASVESAFSIDPEVPGRLEWPDERTVRFVPSVEWVRGAAYAVTIAGTARDRSGSPIAGPIAFTVTIVGHISVTHTVPAADSTEIAVDASIVIIFNRPVVPLRAISDPAAADLANPVRFEPEIPGTGEWLNTSIYVFHPDDPLIGGTTYTAVVPSGLTDTSGGLLPDDVVWRFSTERPKVVSVSPRRDAELVGVDQSVVVRFNMPIDAGSAEGRFSLRTSGLLGDLLSRPVSGTVTVVGDSLTFRPDEPLAFDRAYVASIGAGIRAAGGGDGADTGVEWRFRTVPLPRIVGTTPRDGEKTASPYTSFSIRFNAPIAPDSVMENVSIEPAPDPAKVHTYFRSWDHTFVISFGAEPSRSYVVAIGPNITDPYGNVTGQTMRVKFETDALPPTAWLHLPDRVGTFDAGLPARLFIAHRNIDRATFSLYRLTLDQYFDAMNDWYDFRPSPTARVRQWSVAVSSPLNEIAYTPIDLDAEGGCLGPGIYLIDLLPHGVSWSRWQHRHLLVVTPVNLSTKSTDDETLVWATDLETGAPVPGLIVRAYGADGDPVDVTITDRDGLAVIDGTGDWRGLVLASASPFTLTDTGWDEGISVWEFGYSYESPPDRRVYVYTDRPLYRAGHTVFFRGIVRDEGDADYTLPDGREIAVRVYDAARDLAYERTIPLDSTGGFSGEFRLDAGAALGTYRIETAFDRTASWSSFEVAAYRVPEFEVSVRPERDALPRGTAFDVAVEVEYFFGGPVRDVPVSWRVLSAPFVFAPDGFGRYTFTDDDDPWSCWTCWWWSPPSAVSPVLEGSGRTDDDGQLVVRIPETISSSAPGTGAPAGSRTLTIEATAQGADGQVLSGRSRVIVHQGDYYVGLAASAAIGRAGDALPIDLVTVGWGGERVPDRDVAYTIYRREWVNSFESDGAGGGRWIWTTNDVEVDSGRTRTGALGRGAFSFVPPEGGVYKIAAQSLDEAERTVRSNLFVWASGPGAVSWRRTNDDRITLITDRTTYAPGDVAEILIPSPYPGEQWALVSVERGGILSREVVPLPTNSSVYRLPITEEHIPNIYVSVVLVQGRAAAQAVADGAGAPGTKVGYAALTVRDESRRLTIELESSDRAPQPGGTVDYAIRVTDADGDPVRAALSFDLVDKAVLSLLPRAADAIVDAFYGRRGLGVRTGSALTRSINRLLLEQLEQAGLVDETKYAAGDVRTGAVLPMAAMEDVDRGAAPPSAAAQLPMGIELREEFADTAFWTADVVTGADGIAHLMIDLPDNLTTWIARAIGVTAETLVGERIEELLVTRPLLIRPVAPRFFVVGDRVQLAAIVTNRTGEGRTVKVTLGQTGLALEEPAVRTIVVPAGGETKVTWWARVLDGPAIDLAVGAVSGELSDAARPRHADADGRLPVYRYTAPETVGTAGEIDRAGARTEIIALPTGAELDRSELIVRLAPSLAAAMQDGLDYLEHFEYECTEQVVSRFLPNALTYRALVRLGMEDPELKRTLDRLVPTGLEKLYVRQHRDGGWGWWDEAGSNPHLSAYVVFALLLTEDAGFLVRDGVIERGLDYLVDALVPIDALDRPSNANRQAWLAYVLSLGGRSAAVGRTIDALFERRAVLDHYAAAFLALTLPPGDRRAATLLSDLYGEAILSATGAHWKESSVDRWTMNTDTRSTAIIVDALVQLDPKNPLIANAVRWLMVARRDGIWETTQETAWALMALTRWMESTGELHGAYDYWVDLNEIGIASGAVGPGTVRDSVDLRVSAVDLLGAGSDRLTVGRGAGEGRLYYTAHLSVRLPVEEVEPVSRGIIVQRQYISDACPADGRCPDVNRAAVGETVRVRLTIIAPHDLYYVVVEDPLPAGTEAIDPALATTSVVDPSPGVRRASDDRPWLWWWWWRWYSRSELRDEKAVLFADYLPAGTYVYEYAVRAVQPGEYRVLPASAHEFYFPEVFGRSGGRLFTVVEAEE